MESTTIPWLGFILVISLPFISSRDCMSHFDTTNAKPALRLVWWVTLFAFCLAGCGVRHHWIERYHLPHGVELRTETWRENGFAGKANWCRATASIDGGTEELVVAQKPVFGGWQCTLCDGVTVQRMGPVITIRTGPWTLARDRDGRWQLSGTGDVLP
jgi:hypothetical protein